MTARTLWHLLWTALLVVVAVPRSSAAPAEERRIYTYDSSGNVRSISDPVRQITDRYAYDTAGRLISATTDGNLQEFSYDAFGNRLTAPAATLCLGDTQCGTPLAFNQTTNHFTSAAGAVYDAAGSVTQLNGGAAQYTYDALGMMTRSVANGGLDQRAYIYTADDERIAVERSGTTEWTIRHLDGKPLRDFRETSAEGTVWTADHVWRSGQMLATVSREGVSTTTHHHHLDHLGTPRLITDSSGMEVARHSYSPFGPEIEMTPHESPEVRLKYTGHERDLIPGSTSTLDYMHARYYNGVMGRFLSVDPVIDVKRVVRNPQGWNRYAYVSNNPINSFDPDGRLQKDANGDVVFTADREDVVTFARNQADPRGEITVTWKAQIGHVLADDGTKIAASRAVGDIAVTIKAKDGTVTTGGRELLPIHSSSADNSANCHGTTFANGQVYIGNSQVAKIIKGDGYVATGSSVPRVGDIGIYTSDGNLSNAQHSVSVIRQDYGWIPMVLSKGGIAPSIVTTPGPGPGTAWPGGKLQYFRKKD